MRIVDAHHHFWDPAANYHPWLRDEPQIPFRYGDYGPIRGRFMPQDYDRLTGRFEVVASVTMEGEWDPADPTGEARWMQALRAATGRPAAHVAQAWLDRADLDAVLGVYRDLPVVRSVRHKPRATPAPDMGPGGMSEPEFRAGFARVAAEGLAFDLQTNWWHLDEVTRLLNGGAETDIILDHAGLPSDRSPEALAAWRAAVARFARLPRTWVKISGLGLPGRPWSLADNRGIIRCLIDTFGPDRAMFASNFPVDGLCGDFSTIWDGFDAATAGDAAEDRAALFGNTAARAYELDPDGLRVGP